MMYRKKVTALVLALCLAVSLTACQEQTAAKHQQKAGCHGSQGTPSNDGLFGRTAEFVGLGNQVAGEHSEGVMELFRGHKSKPSFIKYSFRPSRVRWSRLLALLSVMPQ